MLPHLLAHFILLQRRNRKKKAMWIYHNECVQIRDILIELIMDEFEVCVGRNIEFRR